jgi:hypothetical protein
MCREVLKLPMGSLWFKDPSSGGAVSGGGS